MLKVAYKLSDGARILTRDLAHTLYCIACDPSAPSQTTYSLAVFHLLDENIFSVNHEVEGDKIKAKVGKPQHVSEEGHQNRGKMEASDD